MRALLSLILLAGCLGEPAAPSGSISVAAYGFRNRVITGDLGGADSSRDALVVGHDGSGTAIMRTYFGSDAGTLTRVDKVIEYPVGNADTGQNPIVWFEPITAYHEDNGGDTFVLVGYDTVAPGSVATNQRYLFVLHFAGISGTAWGEPVISGGPVYRNIGDYALGGSTVYLFETGQLGTGTLWFGDGFTMWKLPRNYGPGEIPVEVQSGDDPILATEQTMTRGPGDDVFALTTDKAWRLPEPTGDSIEFTGPNVVSLSGNHPSPHRVATYREGGGLVSAVATNANDDYFTLVQAPFMGTPRVGYLLDPDAATTSDVEGIAIDDIAASDEDADVAILDDGELTLFVDPTFADNQNASARPVTGPSLSSDYQMIGAGHFTDNGQAPAGSQLILLSRDNPDSPAYCVQVNMAGDGFDTCPGFPSVP